VRAAYGSVVLLLLAGCSSEIGGPGTDRDRDAGGGGADASADAGTSDAGGGPPPADGGSPPLPEGGPEPLDAGSSCTPTHTECRGELECGAVPDGCPGGSIDCGACGGGELYCAVMETPRWQLRAYNCTQMVQDAHPEYFDPVMFRDTSSWLVLEAFATQYVRDVATCAGGRGAVAIPDMNAPGNEVRIRGDTDDLAENVIVRTYGTGRTAGRYTSTCTPAGF
jgi:hypothetical protein